MPLPVERILKAAPGLAKSLAFSPRAFDGLTRAIMTTDTRPKRAAASCRIGGKTVRVAGCAKGAGMIHPNMATMLSFVVTDAAIEPGVLDVALRDVVGRTFNCITVDGDSSTNDTLLVLANGASGAKKITEASRRGLREIRRRARTGLQNPGDWDRRRRRRRNARGRNRSARRAQ